MATLKGRPTEGTGTGAGAVAGRSARRWLFRTAPRCPTTSVRLPSRAEASRAETALPRAVPRPRRCSSQMEQRAADGGILCPAKSMQF